MKKPSVWMAVVNATDSIVFSKGCLGRQKAESEIVKYLQKNEAFDGKDFNAACFWVGEKDLRLDLMVFEMEAKDFEEIQLQAGLLIKPPPEDKNLYRVVYAIDVYGSDETNAAEEAWKTMRGKDAVGPVLTLIDSNGNQITLDLFDILEFSKITPGFVTQRYRKGSNGTFRCLWQEFTAGDEVQYENSKGDTVDPPNYDVQEFSMTLLSNSQMTFFIRGILKTLDVGGQQSR